MPQLAGFRIGQVIGRGAFAEVRMGENVETKERVALKILDTEAAKREGILDCLYREVQILQNLNHPHCVSLLKLLLSPKKIIMVFPLARGGDLCTYLSKHGRQSETLARSAFTQLLQAVDYLHSCNVYHRDLKCDNILVEASGDLKISDFGFASVGADAPTTGATPSAPAGGLTSPTAGGGETPRAVGTTMYQAPEVVSGGVANLRDADIWAMGIILYAMLTGLHPFTEATTRASLTRIAACRLSFPSYVSASAKRFISRMLTTALPRPSAAQLLADPWLRETTDSGKTPLSPIASRPPRPSATQTESAAAPARVPPSIATPPTGEQIEDFIMSPTAVVDIMSPTYSSLEARDSEPFCNKPCVMLSEVPSNASHPDVPGVDTAACEGSGCAVAVEAHPSWSSAGSSVSMPSDTTEDAQRARAEEEESHEQEAQEEQQAATVMA